MNPVRLSFTASASKVLTRRMGYRELVEIITAYCFVNFSLHLTFFLPTKSAPDNVQLRLRVRLFRID